MSLVRVREVRHGGGGGGGRERRRWWLKKKGGDRGNKKNMKGKKYSNLTHPSADSDLIRPDWVQVQV